MLTTHEAAERLGIKARSVVWLIRNNHLKAEKHGRDYSIEDSEVERYYAERYGPGRPGEALSGIYAIRNTQNGRVYIGSCRHIPERWKSHRKQLSLGTHHNAELQADWNVLGSGVFTFDVLEYAFRDQLVGLERKWITSFQDVAYNKDTGTVAARNGGPHMYERKTDRPRQYYAIEYAYGRNVVNNGNRADHIYQFSTEGERVAFIDQTERAGTDADPIKATHPLVKRALRYIEQGSDWPVAVANN